MSAKTPREVFVLLLSHARNNTERNIKAYQEIGQKAENPDVQEALKARAYVAQDNLKTIDQCFNMIGEKPVQLSGKLHDAFVDEAKSELAEIQTPVARQLYILAKASQLAH
jgi:ferritin-like metal-binding protein YciE